jgi:ligand-binding SRPBCC domain-containing protein
VRRGVAATGSFAVDAAQDDNARMGHVIVETFIRAPREAVFDLARDVNAHNRSASFSSERCVAPGRTEGLLELGDLVTFEGVHFGIRQRFTAKIIKLDRPNVFVDELVKAAFRSMRHVHEFEERDGGTLMRDTLDWVSPFGILGVIADKIAVERHLRVFVTRKQRALKEIAEEA